jgi:hypothetical protein
MPWVHNSPQNAAQANSRRTDRQEKISPKSLIWMKFYCYATITSGQHQGGGTAVFGHPEG